MSATFGNAKNTLNTKRSTNGRERKFCALCKPVGCKLDGFFAGLSLLL